MSTVVEVLDALFAGEMTLREVEEDFRTRKWPPIRRGSMDDRWLGNDFGVDENGWSAVESDSRLTVPTKQRLAAAHTQALTGEPADAETEPPDALTAALEMFHDDCDTEFCRNPLHPGPCKRLGRIVRIAEHREARSRARRPVRGRRGGDGFDPPAEPALRGVPFTEAAQRVQQHFTRIASSGQTRHGSPYTAATAMAQGFDGPPVVGDDDDIDDALEAGGVELWRGIGGDRDPSTAVSYVDALRRGPAYYGYGIYGNGIYAGDQRVIAMEYGAGNRFGAHSSVDHGALVRMALRPGARVIEYSQAKAAHDAWIQQRANETTGMGREEAIAHIGYARQFIDLGAWAALMGFDAIYADEARHAGSSHDTSRHWAILNRTMLVVGDDHVDLPPGTPPQTRIEDPMETDMQRRARGLR